MSLSYDQNAYLQFENRLVSALWWTNYVMETQFVYYIHSNLNIIFLHCNFLLPISCYTKIVASIGSTNLMIWLLYTYFGSIRSKKPSWNTSSEYIRFHIHIFLFALCFFLTIRIYAVEMLCYITLVLRWTRFSLLTFINFQQPLHH